MTATKKSTSRKTTPLKIWGSYGWTEYEPDEWKKVVNRTVRKIKELHAGLKFDAIAFIGSSGCAMGFIIGYKTGIPTIYVRKDNEESHGKSVESNYRGEIKSYLIVDDFICSGKTIKNIVEKINRFADRDLSKKPKAVGVLLYDNTDEVLLDHITVGRTKVKLYQS